MRQVEDWTASGLLTREQRDRIAPDLQVDLRRTNRFLRATLGVFGFLIVNAVAGLVAVFLDVNDELPVALLCAVAGGVTFGVASRLVRKYRLYRFGIEEALAITSVVFFAASAALLFEPYMTGADDLLVSIACGAAAAASFALFRHFGYVYAAVTVICAACVPFQFTDVDWLRRLASIAILAGVYLVARRRRADHGGEFPGDTYAIVEAVAWGGIYVMTNLKISSWLSHTDESGPFYWATYAAIWMLPAAGLWIAAREKHRALLDVSAAMALATLMTNKPYLNAARQAWDPIVFGVLLITVAIVLRRWLAGGADGSRGGFVAERLLASEKERLAVASTATVLQPTGHAAHPPAPEPAVGGGGRSGGAGASGSY
jgi:drug/metabolite transporter (DMT)-like permease